jgi:hypothetical protein
MAESLDRLGGSLLNLVLGGVILWVGQTTFRHSGVLASVDEKFLAVNQQFTEIDKRQESLRKWLENVVNEMKDNNRSQFTAKDGDKLVAQVRQAELVSADLERRVFGRLAELEVQLAALQTSQQDCQEVAALQWHVAQLREALTRMAAAQEVAYPSDGRIARGAPVYLPPVGNPR